jgi:hypothetical protein
VTLSDLHPLHTVDLPSLASDERVTVLVDQESELESCEVCVQRNLQADLTAVVPAGKWRLTYHLRPGGPEWHTDLCGSDCAQTELDEVLNLHHCVGVRLHIPVSPWVLPHPDDDAMCQELVGLRQGIARMRNDGSNDAERLGFESARNKAVAYVQALVNDRIEQLGRTA